ncbi:MAG: hypothetical protein AAGE86_04255 [Pseudomonadota bacterium]
MFEAFDWSMIIWTGAVFLSGYLLGTRQRSEIEPPLDFDISTISPEARARIEQSLQSGSKIEAIRTLREDTGLGLKDSKTIIDRWNTPSVGGQP